MVPPNSSTKVNISLVGDYTKYNFLECVLKNTGIINIPKQQHCENTVEIIPYKTDNYDVIFCDPKGGGVDINLISLLNLMRITTKVIKFNNIYLVN